MKELKDIKGIGPGTEKTLVKAGIASIAALAALTLDELKVKVEAAGGVRGAGDTEMEAWIAEAKAIAAADEPASRSEDSGAVATPAAPGPDAELDARAAAIEAREAELDEREAEVAEREAAIAEREAQVAESGDAGTMNAGHGEEDRYGKVEVTVPGPKTGRYRIGRHFGAAPQTLLVTLEQRDQLKADPALAVAESH